MSEVLMDLMMEAFEQHWPKRLATTMPRGLRFLGRLAGADVLWPTADPELRTLSQAKMRETATRHRTKSVYTVAEVRRLGNTVGKLSTPLQGLGLRNELRNIDAVVRNDDCVWGRPPSGRVQGIALLSMAELSNLSARKSTV